MARKLVVGLALMAVALADSTGGEPFLRLVPSGGYS